MVNLKDLKIQDCFQDNKGTIYIVSAMTNKGEVECVELGNADNIVRYSAKVFAETFIPVATNNNKQRMTIAVNEDYNIHKDSPLSSALIKTSRIVATLNALLRVTLRVAPQDVRQSAVKAIAATKELLQKLVEEIRED